MGFFKKLSEGLRKTRDAIGGIFRRGKIDEEFFEELENALIAADASVGVAEVVTDELRDRVKSEKLREEEEIKAALREILGEYLPDDEDGLEFPAVIMVVGVNGVGKTTSIGKLANYFLKRKKSVTLAAADTFRAAASDQLSIWGDRADVRVIKHAEGADPSAVVYDAIASCRQKKTDVLIVDTAGRLHNKTNLMEELKKMNRIIDREYPEAAHYNFIVLDASLGQNGVQQVRAFHEAVELDGIILTKLDGTSKGGVVFAVEQEADIPVRFVGLGEKLDDLEEFDKKSFIEAIV